MGVQLNTGYTQNDVTAENDGSLYSNIFGNGNYVLENGNQFAYEVLSVNSIKISDGDAVMQGRHIQIMPDDVDYVDISNGTSGMNRIDLICIKYLKSEGEESASLVVYEGTPTSGEPAEPTYTTGDILSGALESNMPLYAVRIEGLTIASVTQKFTTVEALKTLADRVTNKTKGAISSVTSSNLTASRVVVSNASGKIAASSITPTELGYLSGLNENVKSAFSSIRSTLSTVAGNLTTAMSGALSTVNGSNLTAGRVLISNSSGKIAVSSITSTILGYLSTLTGNVQTQINSAAKTVKIRTESTTLTGTVAANSYLKLEGFDIVVGTDEAIVGILGVSNNHPSCCVAAMSVVGGSVYVTVKNTSGGSLNESVTVTVAIAKVSS